MNTKHILIAALLAGAFAPAMARTDNPAAASLPLALAGVTSAVTNGDTGGGLGARRTIVHGDEVGGSQAEHGPLAGQNMQMHARSIKNAPYSAEVISEQQHNLADGNQIVNKSTSMSYRDSAGRTRQELREASGNVRSITIQDAVEGVTYLLNPETKIATKIASPRFMARAGDKARAVNDEMHGDGGEQVIVKRIERQGDGEARQPRREEVRIHVTKVPDNGQARPGMDRIGPILAGAFIDMKWSSKATVKDLGLKDIDGIKAQGKLKSYEIPAGEIGNRDAIVVTVESWYSPDLKVTLLNKRSDPRTGERTWRMAGIKREEPAAALFTVPSDYTVKDLMAQFRKNDNAEKK